MPRLLRPDPKGSGRRASPLSGCRSRLSGTGPVKRYVLAGSNPPLEVVTERIDGTDCGLAPGHDLYRSRLMGLRRRQWFRPSVSAMFRISRHSELEFQVQVND